MKSTLMSTVRYVAAALALLVIANTAKADAKLLLETGYVHMTSAPDDFWYEQALPHSTEFNTVAFGAGVRFDVSRVQFTLGWRNLGNQHQWADIISDAGYFACRGKPSTCPAPVSVWRETGNTSQAYAELGYAFHLGSFKLVPSVGFGELHQGSHVDMYRLSDMKLTSTGRYYCSAPPQNLPRPFFGLTLQRGAFGVGVDMLNTEPNRGANACSSPIQGSAAEYIRFTYTIGGK